MKRIIYLLCLSVTFLSLKCHAAIPEDAIRFIFDGHLYLQVTLNDSIPISVIYDTGADFLHFDEDYLKASGQQDAFGKKTKSYMRGAGNKDLIQVNVFIDPIKIHCGKQDYTNKITPIIRLRDMLGRYADGLLGNNQLLQSPLMINFSEEFIRPLEHPVPAHLTEGYRKLDAKFEGNRIYIKSKLTIDAENVVDGWFVMDMGSGGSVTLTREAASNLHLEKIPQARYAALAGGIGGGAETVSLRASGFTMGDTLENIVISYSLNQKGFLSSNKTCLGLIGNIIWSHYDIILDPVNGSVWVKRNNREATYSKSSTTHMSAIDRTDICDGWSVNILYEGGIAQKAGFELGDVILSINGRPVKDISWEEQRKGLGLEGNTVYKVRKKNGETVTYTLYIKEQII